MILLLRFISDDSSEVKANEAALGLSVMFVIVVD
jgi:hypothetical protein